VKVEGGHVEGGAGGRAGGQARDRVARVGRLGQGRGTEALAFLVLPQPVALTRATLVGGF
jgi:hypothetical protein